MVIISEVFIKLSFLEYNMIIKIVNCMFGINVRSCFCINKKDVKSEISIIL